MVVFGKGFDLDELLFLVFCLFFFLNRGNVNTLLIIVPSKLIFAICIEVIPVRIVEAFIRHNPESISVLLGFWGPYEFFFSLIHVYNYTQDRFDSPF